jgi:hypothetical protein
MVIKAFHLVLKFYDVISKNGNELFLCHSKNTEDLFLGKLCLILIPKTRPYLLLS